MNPASPAYFTSPGPVKRLRDISPFPFVQELIPIDSSLLYDLEKLIEENIDLEMHMLWYRIPSLKAVVFFRWSQAPEEYVPEDTHQILDAAESDADDHFAFEVRDGTIVEDDQYSEYRKMYFMMIPCTYDEAAVFYHRLISAEGRAMLQKEFMQALNACEDEATAENNISSRIGFDEQGHGYSEREDLEGWQNSESLGYSSDEDADSALFVAKTPNRRVALIVEQSEFESRSWEGLAARFKVRVGRRLRNPSSMGDLTPTRHTCFLPDE